MLRIEPGGPVLRSYYSRSDGDNVHKEGVLCWERCSYPLVSFHVVRPWLQAKDHAIPLPRRYVSGREGVGNHEDAAATLILLGP